MLKMPVGIVHNGILVRRSSDMCRHSKLHRLTVSEFSPPCPAKPYSEVRDLAKQIAERRGYTPNAGTGTGLGTLQSVDPERTLHRTFGRLLTLIAVMTIFRPYVSPLMRRLRLLIESTALL